MKDFFKYSGIDNMILVGYNVTINIEEEVF